MPASGKSRGAAVGRPVDHRPRSPSSDAEERARHARPATAGHQGRAPTTPAPRPGAAAHGSASGSSSDQRAALVAVALAGGSTRGVEQGRGGVERRAPAASQVASPSGCPAASASDGGHEPELGDEAVVVGGQLAVDAAGEGVGGQLPFAARGGRVAAPPLALGEPREGAGRRPAGRRPRRSTWLLADEPRLRKAARYSLVPPDLAQRPRGCPRTGRPTPGQSSSSRRTHAQLISRTPSSIPLVQWTPERNGFAAHHDRSCAVDDLGVPVVAGQPPGGGQHRQVVVARELPDRLDVARDGLVAVVDAEGERVLRCAPPGDRVAGTSPGRRCRDAAMPSTAQSPASSRSAAATTRRAASGGTCSRAPGGDRASRDRAVPSRPGHGAAGVARAHLAPRPGDLSAAVADARDAPRPATSGAAAARTSPGRPAHGATGPSGDQARRRPRGSRGSWRRASRGDRHRPRRAGPPRRSRRARPLALVLAGERRAWRPCRRGSTPWPG